MSKLTLLLLALLLAACSASPPPSLSNTTGPEDPSAPSAQTPYRTVLAGTANHGIGDRP